MVRKLILLSYFDILNSLNALSFSFLSTCFSEDIAVCQLHCASFSTIYIHTLSLNGNPLFQVLHITHFAKELSMIKIDIPVIN